MDNIRSNVSWIPISQEKLGYIGKLTPVAAWVASEDPSLEHPIYYLSNFNNDNYKDNRAGTCYCTACRKMFPVDDQVVDDIKNDRVLTAEESECSECGNVAAVYKLEPQARSVSRRSSPGPITHEGCYEVPMSASGRYLFEARGKDGKSINAVVDNLMMHSAIIYPNGKAYHFDTEYSSRFDMKTGEHKAVKTYIGYDPSDASGHIARNGENKHQSIAGKRFSMVKGGGFNFFTSQARDYMVGHDNKVTKNEEKDEFRDLMVYGRFDPHEISKTDREVSKFPSLVANPLGSSKFFDGKFNYWPGFDDKDQEDMSYSDVDLIPYTTLTLTGVLSPGHYFPYMSMFNVEPCKTEIESTGHIRNSHIGAVEVSYRMASYIAESRLSKDIDTFYTDFEHNGLFVAKHGVYDTDKGKDDTINGYLYGIYTEMMLSYPRMFEYACEKTDKRLETFKQAGGDRDEKEVPASVKAKIFREEMAIGAMQLAGMEDNIRKAIAESKNLDDMKSKLAFHVFGADAEEGVSKPSYARLYDNGKEMLPVEGDKEELRKAFEKDMVGVASTCYTAHKLGIHTTEARVRLLRIAGDSPSPKPRRVHKKEDGSHFNIYADDYAADKFRAVGMIAPIRTQIGLRYFKRYAEGLSEDEIIDGIYNKEAFETHSKALYLYAQMCNYDRRIASLSADRIIMMQSALYMSGGHSREEAMQVFGEKYGLDEKKREKLISGIPVNEISFDNRYGAVSKVPVFDGKPVDAVYYLNFSSKSSAIPISGPDDLRLYLMEARDIAEVFSKKDPQVLLENMKDVALKYKNYSSYDSSRIWGNATTKRFHEIVASDDELMGLSGGNKKNSVKETEKDLDFV